MTNFLRSLLKRLAPELLLNRTRGNARGPVWLDMMAFKITTLKVST